MSETLDRRTRMAKLLADFEQNIAPSWDAVRDRYAEDPDSILLDLAIALQKLDVARNMPGLGLVAILGIVGAMHALQKMAEWEVELSCTHDWVQVNGVPSIVKCSKCGAEK